MLATTCESDLVKVNVTAQSPQDFLKLISKIYNSPTQQKKHLDPKDGPRWWTAHKLGLYSLDAYSAPVWSSLIIWKCMSHIYTIFYLEGNGQSMARFVYQEGRKGCPAGSSFSSSLPLADIGCNLPCNLTNPTMDPKHLRMNS